MFPLLAQVMTTLKLPKNKQTFKLFLSFDKEARRDMKYFKKVMANTGIWLIDLIKAVKETGLVLLVHKTFSFIL